MIPAEVEEGREEQGEAGEGRERERRGERGEILKGKVIYFSGPGPISSRPLLTPQDSSVFCRVNSSLSFASMGGA